MAKEIPAELKFELGQWVSTEDGYGQIMYIRPLYVEPYETYRQDRKNGAFIRYIFICKILCGFEGKIRNKIHVYTSISKIDKGGAAFVKAIKENQPTEYYNYIVYDTKTDLCGQLFLTYKVNKSELKVEDLKQNLSAITTQLYPAFTFKELVKTCRDQQFPVDLEQFILYGRAAKKEESITLRLDSFLYKVKGKEAIFHDARLFDFSSD